jgi:hypothetical protein
LKALVWQLFERYVGCALTCHASSAGSNWRCAGSSKPALEAWYPHGRWIRRAIEGCFRGCFDHSLILWRRRRREKTHRMTRPLSRGGRNQGAQALQSAPAWSVTWPHGGMRRSPSMQLWRTAWGKPFGINCVTCTLYIQILSFVPGRP